MNREIKFRAWDGKKMIPPDSLSYFVEFDGSVWKNRGTMEHDNLEQKDNLVLMQYVGLKDKEGVEIYEGDMVRSWGTIILIEYLNGAFGYYSGKGTDWPEFHAFATHNSLSINDGNCKQFEVIGNKFQQPNFVQ